jgi:hypothetical protein
MARFVPVALAVYCLSRRVSSKVNISLTGPAPKAAKTLFARLHVALNAAKFLEMSPGDMSGLRVELSMAGRAGSSQRITGTDVDKVHGIVVTLTEYLLEHKLEVVEVPTAQLLLAQAKLVPIVKSVIQTMEAGEMSEENHPHLYQKLVDFYYYVCQACGIT